MSVYEPAEQETDVSDGNQSDLLTFSNAGVEAYELPRHDECRVCDGTGMHGDVECFACVDYEALNSEAAQ